VGTRNKLGRNIVDNLFEDTATASFVLEFSVQLHLIQFTVWIWIFSRLNTFPSYLFLRIVLYTLIISFRNSCTSSFRSWPFNQSVLLSRNTWHWTRHYGRIQPPLTGGPKIIIGKTTCGKT